MHFALCDKVTELFAESRLKSCVIESTNGRFFFCRRPIDQTVCEYRRENLQPVIAFMTVTLAASHKAFTIYALLSDEVYACILRKPSAV